MPTTVVKTIRASGGDYTTLSAWEAANQGGLVTADEVRVAECYNDWPSGLNDAVTIDGSTTDATRYMAITVAAGHRHTGKPDTGFRIVRSAAYGAVVLFNDPYCRASWLDVRNTGTEGSAIRQNGSNGSNSRASRCIGRTTGTAAYVSCFAGLAYTYQCLAIGGIQGFQGTGGYGTFEMVGCVASGSTTGFQLDSPGTDKRVANCVAYNCTNNYTGTFDAALSGNNASTSGTMPGSSNVSGISSADFVDAAGHDYHLAGGSALIGMGANLYTLITEDVDGDAWPSSGAWDIGFDYYVSAGGAVDLVIADATHSHTSDSLGLTSASLLSIAGAAHSHMADGVALSTAHVLAVADALHGHAADVLALATQSALAVADAGHAHLADALSLSASGAATLAIAESSHAHSADAIALTTASLLAVADALHAHTADSASLGAALYLAISASLHGHAVDAIGLTDQPTLGVADTAHSHASDTPALSSHALLAVADAVHAHLADGTGLGYAATLAILESMHAHASDVLAMSSGGSSTLGLPDEIRIVIAEQFIKIVRAERHIFRS